LKRFGVLGRPLLVRPDNAYGHGKRAALSQDLR
jgi:hypothetical protein